MGLNIPKLSDVQSGLEVFGPGADMKAMVDLSRTGWEAGKRGDVVGAIGDIGLAALAPLGAVIPGTVGDVKKGVKKLTGRNKNSSITLPEVSVGGKREYDFEMIPMSSDKDLPLSKWTTEAEKFYLDKDVSTKAAKDYFINKKYPYPQPKTLREFGEKQAALLGKEESRKIVGEKDGLPIILFHASDYPFKEWSKEASVFGEFSSFSTNPAAIEEYLIGYEGSRSIIGMAKVDKLFDYENLSDVRKLVNRVKKNKMEYLNEFPKGEAQKELTRLKNKIQEGGWQAIEAEATQEALRDLGFDSFTTWENGKNVMLMKPKEQFIPLFDPKKTSKLGYTYGGVIRNPYDGYSPRAI
jgi:hypothetical protein